VAVVTGGSASICSGSAKRFAANGARVLGTSMAFSYSLTAASPSNHQHTDFDD
jgi:NADP-dependent 3-hydroxy acid dehydrogenase YdfG